MSQRERIRYFLVLVVVAMGFFVVGVGLTASLNKVQPVAGVSEEPIKPPEPSKFLASSQESFREIVAAVRPAVCTIEVIARVPGMRTDMYDMFKDDPFFEWFFGPQRGPQTPQPEEFEVPSSGSGFIVDPEGYILTNNHVVQGADEIKVILDGDDEYEAEIIGLDVASDVAVLKIEGDGAFPYIEMGDSDKIQAGDWVMAVGNPFGYLDHTITVGVISAKNREHITGAQYENFLQTDAAINFGNSGGPLVDIYGRAVGINTAITAHGSGIGFAVPINMAKHVYNDFIQFGEVRRAWIGVTIENLTSEKADELGLDRTKGALVTSVSEGDPADEAGIEVDDFIIAVDGDSIESASQLMRVIAAKDIGELMEITLIRDGREMDVTVVPGKRSETPIIQGGENIISISELGLTIRDMDDELRGELKIPEDVEGVIISQVDPRSHAQGKGLRAGVIITHLSGEAVGSVERFLSIFEGLKDEKSVVVDVLYVRSDGSTDSDVIALKLK
jgi:Do/DeqQ family serine protease